MGIAAAPFQCGECGWPVSIRVAAGLLPAVFPGADAEEFPEGFREVADIFKAAGISRFQNGQIGLCQKLRTSAQPERVQVADGKDITCY